MLPCTESASKKGSAHFAKLPSRFTGLTGALLPDMKLGQPVVSRFQTLAAREIYAQLAATREYIRKNARQGTTTSGVFAASLNPTYLYAHSSKSEGKRAAHKGLGLS